MIKFRFFVSQPSFFRKSFQISFKRHFSSAQASFYDLLEIDRKCSLLDIKSAYYKKVKIYHPDHNKDPKAEEHFKLIVRAYETLKDPSKRYIYDLSEKNPQFREDFKENDDYVYSDWRENTSARKYYENKWYGYRKDSTQNMREEYFDSRVKEDETTKDFKILMLRLCFVVVLIAIFELWKEKKHKKHRDFRNIQREVINNDDLNSPKLVLLDKNQKFAIDLAEYIKEREKEHADG